MRFDTNTRPYGRYFLRAVYDVVRESDHVHIRDVCIFLFGKIFLGANTFTSTCTISIN